MALGALPALRVHRWTLSPAACVDSASGVRVCHMQQERSRRIMAEVQVYASVDQVTPLSPGTPPFHSRVPSMP